MSNTNSISSVICFICAAVAIAVSAIGIEQKPIYGFFWFLYLMILSKHESSIQMEDFSTVLSSCHSELGNELTFLAGNELRTSELRTSELDTSELKTSEYRFADHIILSETIPSSLHSDLSPEDKERTIVQCEVASWNGSMNQPKKTEIITTVHDELNTFIRTKRNIHDYYPFEPHSSLCGDINDDHVQNDS
ncbi:hypothetical protein Tco_0418930 [Tanacetum coccineum]